METTKKKAVSGKRCVAAGCSNTKTNTTGVALFLFPKDGGQALLWNKEVKRTRLDWTTHTKYSVLCSEHFEQSCFEEGHLQRAAMGIATTRRLVLKKGAKPTIFNRPRPCLSASLTSSEHPTPSTSGQTVHMRSAFAKRERKRTIDQIMASTTTASVADAVDEPMAMALDLPDEEGDQDQGNTREQGCQTDWVPIGRAPTAMTSSKSTQTGKIHHRSKGHQVTPEILERVRARLARVSEVPSSSVAAPSDSPEMQTNIATPGAPALFDVGPASSPTAPFVSGSSDDSYVPSESSPDRPRTHQMREEGCHKEPKYIIFKSCLQSLVKWCHCPVCGSQDISPSWDSNGTQLTMTLQCASCDQRSSWSSQPNIGPYAAGNILLSAGILFAGASSGKVLQVLNGIGVVTYVKRTFFNHQELILQPAIKKVWEEQQRTHLTMLQVEGRPLVLGGDGRAGLVPTPQWSLWPMWFSTFRLYRATNVLAATIWRWKD
ncbi:peroxynitrite isomerase THAP4-like isoform X1 [Entelurus aequoreus]|uniref:peroxynitrite isomerase THAP4-like isoform X1 n=2 Tax=Entelurus aequoreus TaxID=161455 RepID=UPI002B1D21F2|nr:peroxynitrite isomerase THAP4-like isoform X1 [Entelurus aequoreus]